MEAAEVAAVVGKVAERLDAEDYDDHDGITEESVAKVMGWLELEIKLARAALAAGAAAPPPLPAPAPAPAGYVTVSGNEESCGSSLSGPASTVMASVDGWAGASAPPAVQWPWPWPEAAAAAAGYKDDGDGDEDDEWVSQLLTDGPEGDGPYGGQ